MTMQPERPERAAADDRATPTADVGRDPMHPHPQERPLGDEPDHSQDDPDDPGKNDDEVPVDRYRDSPAPPRRGR